MKRRDFLKIVGSAALMPSEVLKIYRPKRDLLKDCYGSKKWKK